MSPRHNFHKLAPESLTPVLFPELGHLHGRVCPWLLPIKPLLAGWPIHGGDKCVVYNLIKVSDRFHKVWSPPSVFLVQLPGRLRWGRIKSDSRKPKMLSRDWGQVDRDEATRAKPSLSYGEELELTTSPVTIFKRQSETASRRLTVWINVKDFKRIDHWHWEMWTWIRS